MHMVFIHLLSLFWAAAMVFGIFKIQRSSMQHKKRWTVCVVLLALVLWELSGLLVYVIPFSSPEAAYQSIHPQFMQAEHEPLILEGKTSALMVEGDVSEQSLQVIIRKNDRWKLSSHFNSPFPYTIHDNGISIYVYSLRGSQDHYVCVLLPPFETESSIESPSSTVFYEFPAPDDNTDAPSFRNFYAYIGTLDSDYTVTVNGTPFCIPKASELGDPAPLWPQFLLLIGVVVLLAVGSIGIIRIRALSKVRKAVLIFLLLLLTMSLGLSLTMQFST